MREFVKTVKQCFRVSKDEFFVFSGFAFFGGIFGIVVSLILMNMDAMEGEYATIGAMIGVIMGTILLFVLEILSMQQDFNLAISLGKTRKHYIPARFLFEVVNCGLCVATISVIGLIEHFLYSTFFPGTVCGFDMLELLLHPVFLIGFLFLLPAITLLGGACFLKFGAKCAWVFWALWMIFCIGFPRMINAIEEENDSLLRRMGMGFINFLEQLTPLKIAVGILIVGLAALAAAFGILRKQRVTA